MWLYLLYGYASDPSKHEAGDTLRSLATLRIDQLPDFLEGGFGIANITHDYPTGRNVSETESGERICISGRTGSQRRQIDRAQAIRALEDALTQGGLFHVAKFDHLLVDGEKTLIEFEPVGIEAVFSPAVIQFFAHIGHNGNCKERDRADRIGSGQRIRKQAGSRTYSTKKTATPNREEQLQRQLRQQRDPANEHRPDR